MTLFINQFSFKTYPILCFVYLATISRGALASVLCTHKSSNVLPFGLWTTECQIHLPATTAQRFPKN